MKKLLKISIIFLTSLSLFCCSYKPILYQNAAYTKSGEEKVQQEIDFCTKEASDYLDKYKKERAMKEAGRKAVIGSVIGAASGFIFGHNLKSLIVGTAIGAGIGGASGALGVAAEGHVSPDRIKQNYITTCLANKGYQVIGWQ